MANGQCSHLHFFLLLYAHFKQNSRHCQKEEFKALSNSGFLNSALSAFWTRNFLATFWVSMYCRMFNTFLASTHQMPAASPPPKLLQSKTISGHCQMSPGEQSGPRLRTTDLRISASKKKNIFKLNNSLLFSKVTPIMTQSLYFKNTANLHFSNDSNNNNSIVFPKVNWAQLTSVPSWTYQEMS